MILRRAVRLFFSDEAVILGSAVHSWLLLRTVPRAQRAGLRWQIESPRRVHTSARPRYSLTGPDSATSQAAADLHNRPSNNSLPRNRMQIPTMENSASDKIPPTAESVSDAR